MGTTSCGGPPSSHYNGQPTRIRWSAQFILEACDVRGVVVVGGVGVGLEYLGGRQALGLGWGNGWNWGGWGSDWVGVLWEGWFVVLVGFSGHCGVWMGRGFVRWDSVDGVGVVGGLSVDGVVRGVGVVVGSWECRMVVVGGCAVWRRVGGVYCFVWGGGGMGRGVRLRGGLDGLGWCVRMGTMLGRRVVCRGLGDGRWVGVWRGESSDGDVGYVGFDIKSSGTPSMLQREELFMQMSPPKECYELIENMTAHHNHWDTSATRDEMTRNISSTTTIESPEVIRQLEMMNKNFVEMMRQIQMVKTVDRNARMVCGPHSFRDGAQPPMVLHLRGVLCY
ncbi:hypothetical protein Tco_0660596 [Tanacetum coccineum]